MTVIFSKGDFWKNGVGTPSTGFKLCQYISKHILDHLQRLWREVKAFLIHPESPGKGSWNLWILSFQFSGSIISSTVRTLFSSRFLTFHVCLVVRSNRAILFSFAFLVMLLTWIDISESWEIQVFLVAAIWSGMQVQLSSEEAWS